MCGCMRFPFCLLISALVLRSFSLFSSFSFLSFSLCFSPIYLLSIFCPSFPFFVSHIIFGYADDDDYERIVRQHGPGVLRDAFLSNIKKNGKSFFTWIFPLNNFTLVYMLPGTGEERTDKEGEKVVLKRQGGRAREEENGEKRVFFLLTPSLLRCDRERERKTQGSFHSWREQTVAQVDPLDRRWHCSDSFGSWGNPRNQILQGNKEPVTCA